MLTGPVPILGGAALIEVEAVAADPLARMFDQDYRRLVRAAYLLLGSREEAEEVVQEAFVKLAGAFWRIRQVDKAGGYLRACVLNGARGRLRRRGVARRHAPVFVLDAAGAERGALPPLGPAEEAERDQVSTALRQALDRLPERQRECIVLRYYLGMSEAETAKAMGVSAGSVKTHHSRAIAALGGYMEDYR